MKGGNRAIHLGKDAEILTRNTESGYLERWVQAYACSLPLPQIPQEI